MQGNIWPTIFTDSRFSAMTRDALCVLHVTPRQSQCVEDDIFRHEANAPEGSWSWDLRQRRAC